MGLRTSGKFYLGSWYVPEFPIPTQQDWLFSLNEVGDLTDTQNVEELNINPEDMDQLPQDIQSGAAQWVTFSVPSGDFYTTAEYRTGSRLGGFYVQSVPGVGGFYLQDIGI